MFSLIKHLVYFQHCYKEKMSCFLRVGIAFKAAIMVILQRDQQCFEGVWGGLRGGDKF